MKPPTRTERIVRLEQQLELLRRDRLHDAAEHRSQQSRAISMLVIAVYCLVIGAVLGRRLAK